MKVLVLESHPGVGADASSQLESAGHEVVRCDSPDRTMPCRGLAGARDCPLDHPVDVALVVHEPGENHIEHGALCAARERVPVVDLATPIVLSPYRSIATPVDADADVVTSCERAAADGSSHADAVRLKLLELGVVTRAELEPVDGTIGVDVRRSSGRLAMTLVFDGIDAAREAAIVRASESALREFDRAARVIDVSVRHTAVG